AVRRARYPGRAEAGGGGRAVDAGDPAGGAGAATADRGGVRRHEPGEFREYPEQPVYVQPGDLHADRELPGEAVDGAAGGGEPGVAVGGEDHVLIGRAEKDLAADKRR